MFQHLKSVFLLGRNDCFSGGGGINFVTKKSEFFSFFLHVGNWFYYKLTFKICSAVVNAENM